MTSVLNNIAPIRRSNRAGGRKAARWLGPEAVAIKQLRRRLERRWKKQGKESDRLAYRAVCRRSNELINASRNRFRCQRVVEAGKDSRRVWSAVKELLCTNHHELVTTSTVADASFCSMLAVFFVNKVRNIKVAISAALTSQQFDPLSSDQPFSGDLMSKFSEVTEDEVERLLKSMPSTSSPLDFIPTSLIKSCSGVFAQVIARLANLSFEHSTFPVKFKTAQVTPLLKKHGLDVSDPANYCPISNLNTISKILERLVLVRIVPHVSTSSSFDVVQSA